jgi:hypothetical protein
MKKEEIKQKKNPILKFIINLGLLLMGSVMVFSGLLIQINYHIGNHGDIDPNKAVFGIDYSGWSSIHKIAIVIVSFLMILHIILHWKWYKTVLQKHLISENKQVTILSILFILVVITGYIPWFIHLSSGSELARKLLIEIHDKIALILTVFLILHVIKRIKWYFTAMKKLK